MSKSIKVSQEVYQMLLEIQRPRETFSELVARLLLMTELLNKVEPLLRGSHEFYQSRVAQADAQKATQR